MKKVKELTWEQLTARCNPDAFTFRDTTEVEPLEGIIGQERAVKAIKFGLRIGMRGYNIYMSGQTGTGKTSYIHSYLKRIAENQKIPDDWCYVYNFEKSNHPISLNLPAGMGKIFQKDMDDLIKLLDTEISRAFDSDDYEREKNDILKEFQNRRNELMEQLNQDAEKQGFKVKTTNSGIYFLPVIEGKTISEQEYSDLDETLKFEINEKSNVIQMETLDIIRKIKTVEKEATEKVEEWENKIALYAVGVHINDLIEKYKEYPKIIKFLEDIQKDILTNLDDFRGEENNQEVSAAMLPWMKMTESSPSDKYRVNLLVDNSNLKGAPVIVDFNPTYSNLIGRFEYESEYGNVVTDYTMIKHGLCHQANGGFLILQARDLLSNPHSWEALKRILKTKQITIENMKEQMGMNAISTLKPQPIPADFKVILVGSTSLYQTLYDYDEDFSKLFKIKADFDEEMDKTGDNIYKLAQFISSFCRKEKTLHFDRSGVACVARYSGWLVENQEKLSTRFNDIVEMLCEACAWAEIEGSLLVSEVHVKKAFYEKRNRSNKYDSKLLEFVKDGTILIDTKGMVVGQINGLSILDMGDYTFGKPSRITATTYMGESGIVNIEREVEMSGTSHTKGVLILSGYIGQKFAQDMPLSLSANLCFEQLYSGVDGDSASSAELYAILSSLAEVPLMQSLAVTGSVNQRGEIQPIGGVTAKVEGFYELCRIRGLDGSHGVIIPHQNVKNLMLSDYLIESVAKGLFHIYPISTIDEGIEILTGMSAGIKNKDGIYPENSVYGKVSKKLEKFAKIVAGFGKEDKKPRKSKSSTMTSKSVDIYE